MTAEAETGHTKADKAYVCNTLGNGRSRSVDRGLPGMTASAEADRLNQLRQR
jgi:hypothetical protein